MSSSLTPIPIIREMSLVDVDRVILIEREIFLFPWTPTNFADSIKAGYQCRVMEHYDAVVGYGILMLGPDEGHLLTIGIAAKWHQRGLGTQLLQYFIDLARSKRLTSFLLDVRESNKSAIYLYQRMGFKQIGVRKGYYPAMCGREDALVMRLEL